MPSKAKNINSNAEKQRLNIEKCTLSRRCEIKDQSGLNLYYCYNRTLNREMDIRIKNDNLHFLIEGHISQWTIPEALIEFRTYIRSDTVWFLLISLKINKNN